MEDLYPIAEEGPKYRGRQSIKLRRRFEPQGDGLNAQLGRTFHKKKKKNLDDPPGWTHPGDIFSSFLFVVFLLFVVTICVKIILRVSNYIYSNF